MAEPLNVLLVVLGTHGDVHPFVGIGQAMRDRGHRVRIIANPFFAAMVRAAGLNFTPVGSEEEHRQTHADPDLWRFWRGMRLTLQVGGTYVRPVYQAIAAENEPGKTVVAYSTIALGARASHRSGLGYRRLQFISRPSC